MHAHGYGNGTLGQIRAIFAMGILILAPLASPAAEPWLLASETVKGVNAVQLRWKVQPSITSYEIRKRLSGTTTWSDPIATVHGRVGEYLDQDVQPGEAYEYNAKLVGGTATPRLTLAACAMDLPLIESHGKIILLVDHTVATPLADKLTRLRDDLTGDGWGVIQRIVPREGDLIQGEPVRASDIKEQFVIPAYNADPAAVKAVLIIGHVPVPYSGDIVPDGHNGINPGECHWGAWPADVYYGDVDGAWTDDTNYPLRSEYEWNHNVRDDGKLDQSAIPSDIELVVGRVDLFDMPAFTPPEIELLAQYLDKNHDFRHGITQVPRRALLDYYTKFTEYDSFCMFGTENTVHARWFPELANNFYLFARGGETGDSTYSDQIGSTGDFAANGSRAVFNMLIGSYFGDITFRDCFLKAPLCTPKAGLTSVWAGGSLNLGTYAAEYWRAHYLAFGDTIGNVTKRMQNRRRDTHLLLLGDPTLRMDIIRPPQAVHVNRSAPDGDVTINWLASPDTGLAGYAVYRSDYAHGPFARLNPELVSGTCFVDPQPQNRPLFYMVKAIKRQVSPCGAYINSSQGATGSIEDLAPPPAQLSSISNQTIDEDGSTGDLGFTISGAADPDALTLVAASSDPRVVPHENITLAGTGASRTVSVTPVPGQSGQTTISVTAHDATGAASTEFIVYVRGVTIDSVGDDHRVLVGNSMLLTSEAHGYPAPTYQWRKDGTDIPGATEPHLLLGDAVEADSGDYTVVVANAYDTEESTPINVSVQTCIPYTMYVSHSGSSQYPYDSWSTAADSITKALAAGHPDETDEIIVAQGTYTENTVVPGTFILRSTDPTDPSVVAATVLNGSAGAAPVITLTGGQNNQSVISGFTIQNGANHAPTSTGHFQGGGIAGNGANASVTHCVVENNNADYGGGIGAVHGGISDCIIRNNNADHVNDEGCGAGLYGCNGTVERCLIEGNVSDYLGGGISAGNGMIRNNIISGNTARAGGAGIQGCDAAIHNNTIAGNTDLVSTDFNGSGLLWCWGEIRNCIIWGNESPGGAAQINAAPLIGYCIIEDREPAGNCINDNPMFESATDYHLRSGSPAIDAGALVSWAPTGTDYDGRPRRAPGGGVDIGAYEFTDGDSDGMADWWEQLHGVTDPNADDDGDGMSNLGEFIAGTDPGLAADVLAFTAITHDADAETTVVSWPSRLNRTYALLHSSGVIVDDTWIPVAGSITEGNGDTMSISVSTTGFDKDAYRLLVDFSVNAVNIVGFQDVVVPANDYAMVSCPFYALDGDNSLETIMAGQLTGGSNPAFGDTIMFFDAAQQVYVPCWKIPEEFVEVVGCEWLEGSQPTDEELWPSRGFWINSKHDFDQTVTFVGEVPLEDTAQETIYEGYNMIAYPFFGSSEVRDTDLGSNALPGNTPALADNVIKWLVDQQVYDAYWLTPIGWFRGGQPAFDVSIEGGEGMWFLRRPGNPAFTWTEPRPYSK